MCWNAGSCAGEVNVTSSPTPSPIALDRPYRTDGAFRAEVERMSLPAASEAAGVLVGGAVPDSSVDNAIDLMKTHVPSHYNLVVAENDMKWNRLLVDEDVLGEYNFSFADEIVDYANGVGAEVRGHVLIWGRVKGTTYPEVVATQVEASGNPSAMLLGLMRDHIEAVADHFGERVGVWDVVNEHLTSRIDDNIFYTTLGDAYVKFAFQIAREAFPNSTRLIWNEALGNFDLSDPTISWWLEKLRQYKNESVPIDAIGVQGHNLAKHDTVKLGAFLQAVADIGYDVEITELDAPISLFLDDEEDEDPFVAQGEFFEKYALACLNTRRCSGITFWGLDDSTTWYDFVNPRTKPNLPLLIDEEGYEKPAWLGVRDALLESSADGGMTVAPTASPVQGGTSPPTGEGDGTSAPTDSPSGAAALQRAQISRYAAFVFSALPLFTYIL